MATKKAPSKAAKPEKASEDVEAVAAAPKPKYAENDTSIDARMWRLEQDHKAMGSR